MTAGRRVRRGPVGRDAPGAGARARVLYLPPWRVDVTIRAGVRVPVPVAGLCRAMAAALAAGRAPQPASIGLVLSDDAELAALNAFHLGASGPTDVLSFPLVAPEAFPGHPGAPRTGTSRSVAGPRPEAFVPPGRRVHLGDVVVSVERAASQAAEGRGGQTGDVRWTAADELHLLVVHGALHVCGWDHAAPEEEAAMRRLERRLIEGA